MTIKLMIADDHAIVRAGVKALLADSDIAVVAQAERGDEVLRLIEEHRPQVVLLAVRLPGVDGLATLASIKRIYAELPVVMFTAFGNLNAEARSLALGASGFLLKSISRDELLAAVRRVAAGERLWTRNDARRLGGPITPVEVNTPDGVPLTKRELQVLSRICEGDTNNQIAKRLGISPETVKEHVQHILRKLGVADRTQAAVLAVRLRLV